MNWIKNIDCECEECEIDDIDCKNYKFYYRFNFKINKTYIKTMYKELKKYRGTIYTNGEWNSKYHLPYLIYHNYNNLYEIGIVSINYFINKKIDLEELTQEAFKPSRINYILSIDPEYEF